MTGGLRWLKEMIKRFVLILGADHSSTIIRDSEHNFNEITQFTMEDSYDR